MKAGMKTGVPEEEKPAYLKMGKPAYLKMGKPAYLVFL